jgi:hypothetical protein
MDSLLWLNGTTQRRYCLLLQLQQRTRGCQSTMNVTAARNMHPRRTNVQKGTSIKQPP